MEKEGTVVWLEEELRVLEQTKAGKVGKRAKSQRGHPDCGIPLAVVEDLSVEEANRLRGLSLVTRQSIFSDLCMIYAWENPESGYVLVEKIVDSVRRILNCKDVVSCLSLPERGRGPVRTLIQHEGMELVKKVYESLMRTIDAQSQSTQRFNNRVKERKRQVSFRTYWNDGFLLYRKFVYTCAVTENVSYRTAVEHCAILGRRIATTKNRIGAVIKAWETGCDGDDEMEEYLDARTDWEEGETYEEWYMSQRKIDSVEPEYGEEATDLMNIFKRLVRREAAKKKSERQKKRPTRKPAKKPVTKPKSTPKKAAQTVQKPKKKRAKGKTGKGKRVVAVPVEVAGEGGGMSEGEVELEGDSQVESESESESEEEEGVPIFDPSKSEEVEDEWLVLEIPYLSNEADNRGEPVLVGGEKFVPEGSKDVEVVIFVKIMDTFAYTMERADVIYHGQVQGSEKKDIEERCFSQGIPFLSVVPGEKLWSLKGVYVAHHTCEAYQKCFAGLRLDPVRIHGVLRKVVQKADIERGVLSAVLGVSSMNHEHYAKTPEELKKKLLDGPLWSGTEEVFKLLSPHIRDALDRMQDFIDLLYKKGNKQMPGLLRFQLFAWEFNEKTGCIRNRQEAAAVNLAKLDPRTIVLLRHTDRFNDKRDEAKVTAIWSTCFIEEYVKMRLSLTTYTRQHGGNYTERIASYVAVFQLRIQKLRDLEHYASVNNFKDLDLAELTAAGQCKEETVWGAGSDAAIHCLVVPMHFDPCAFLSPFAWCIDRLRRGFGLCRRHVVELVYLACVQSSVLPFVWLTDKLLQEDPETVQGAVAANGISFVYHHKICEYSGMESGIGGTYSRHQTCLSYHPGMEGRNNKVFTTESQAKKDKEMEELDEIIQAVSNPKHSMGGKEALRAMKKGITFIGDLNSLKVLPLAALVGLVKMEDCFREVLYGECPKGEPHGIELSNLGCDTGHLEQKFVQGLNELLGEPREYFFFGDHVLCMAQGLHLNNRKRRWDVFFPGMPLFRFVEDSSKRIVGVYRKEFGGKTWLPYQAHEWENEV